MKKVSTTRKVFAIIIGVLVGTCVSIGVRFFLFNECRECIIYKIFNDFYLLLIVAYIISFILPRYIKKK
jgi:hypothetical protein